jgi:hypothetical protein
MIDIDKWADEQDAAAAAHDVGALLRSYDAAVNLHYAALSAGDVEAIKDTRWLMDRATRKATVADRFWKDQDARLAVQRIRAGR